MGERVGKYFWDNKDSMRQKRLTQKTHPKAKIVAIKMVKFGKKAKKLKPCGICTTRKDGK